MISGAAEAWKVAEGASRRPRFRCSSAARLPVPYRGRPRSLRRRLRQPGPAARGGRHGCDLLQSGGPAAATAASNLPYEAATAVAFGLPRGCRDQGRHAHPRGRSWGSPIRSGHSKSASEPTSWSPPDTSSSPRPPWSRSSLTASTRTPESRQTQLYTKYLGRLEEVRNGSAILGLERPAQSSRGALHSHSGQPCRPLRPEASAKKTMTRHMAKMVATRRVGQRTATHRIGYQMVGRVPLRSTDPPYQFGRARTAASPAPASP